VYAEPVREHVEALITGQQVSAADIARAAGLSSGTVRGLRKLRTMTRFSAEALLRVTPESANAARVLLDVTPAREHLLQLLEQEDCSAAAITAASGMDDKQIAEVLSGVRSKIHPDTERILLGLNAYVVRRNAALVSPRRAITRLRALQANGHGVFALGERLGFVRRSPYYLTWSGTGRRITQDQDRKAEALYHEIGDRPGPSRRAAAIARDLGYYPPIHYDEDMRLIRESIPDQRWTPLSSPEDRARTNLRILGLTLREYTGAQIAARVGYSAKKVERIRREIGLRLDSNACDSLLLDYIKPGQDALVEQIRRHVEDIDLNESLPMVDKPHLDYVALWDSLRLSAERLRAEVEAWEEHAAREHQAADLASVA
jgi:hypothetical protein